MTSLVEGTLNRHEFTCAECGRHMIQLCGPEEHPRLCGACRTMPGWFKHEEIRRAIAPDHDGKETCER